MGTPGIKIVLPTMHDTTMHTQHFETVYIMHGVSLIFRKKILVTIVPNEEVKQLYWRPFTEVYFATEIGNCLSP